MADQVQTHQPVCRECGAAYPLAGQKCWLCGADLPERAAPSTGQASENPFAASAQRTFSLSSLFLVVTLAAVCLGVFAAAPGLGIFLAIISTPALARTAFVSSRRAQTGASMSVGQKLLSFAGALGIVAVTVVTASGIAVLTTCFTVLGGMAVGMRENSVFTLAFIAGGAVGVGLIACVLYALWGRRPGKARR